MELLFFLISLFIINFLNIFSLFFIIFCCLMSRYYYKKYLLNTKFNKRRKYLFISIQNNFIFKKLIFLYNCLNNYFNIILEEVYKMFYDLIFEIISNNYKKSFQVKKTNNLKIRKETNCNLIKKIKEENELNNLIDEALNEILD